MKLVLIGIQGAGKSTQGNLLSKQLKIPYLSTGHIFREIAKEKTQLGRQVKMLINLGALIPDAKVIEIVNSYLSKPEYKKGYILDGFPRTIQQAKKFINNVDKVIELAIPDKEALWRLAYRDEVRDDNTIEAIRKRIELFHTHTQPVLDYYNKKKMLVSIDGTRSIEEVNDEILKSLGKQLVKNKVQEWDQHQKKIIAVVGMPGAGKSEATEFFRTKDVKVVSFSNIVNDYIDKHKLEHTEKVHKSIREGLRDKHGFEAMAFLSRNKIASAFEKKDIVVIEGMRSWEEYLYIKREFPEVKVFIVAVYADKPLRFQRVNERNYRSKLTGDERDISELIGLHMGPTIAYADFLVKNNFSLQDFHDKLEEVYRTVYFS